MNTSSIFCFLFYFTSFITLYFPLVRIKSTHAPMHPFLTQPTHATHASQKYSSYINLLNLQYTHTHTHKRAGNAGFANMLLNAYYNIYVYVHTHTHTHRKAGNAGFAHMLLNATASRAVTHNQGRGSLAGGEGMMGPGRGS